MASFLWVKRPKCCDSTPAKWAVLRVPVLESAHVAKVEGSGGKDGFWYVLSEVRHFLAELLYPLPIVGV